MLPLQWHHDKQTLLVVCMKTYLHMIYGDMTCLHLVPVPFYIPVFINIFLEQDFTMDSFHVAIAVF